MNTRGICFICGNSGGAQLTRGVREFMTEARDKGLTVKSVTGATPFWGHSVCVRQAMGWLDWKRRQEKKANERS